MEESNTLDVTERTEPDVDKKDEKKKDPPVVVPAWVLPALATAFFSILISFGSAAFTVWNAVNLHDATLATHAKILDQLVTQNGLDRASIARLETKVARLEQEQATFQEGLMDKVDTLLERDRFRRNR